MRDCTFQVAKTKALIRFTVTAKLICVFVFAYANCWFSYEAAYLKSKSAPNQSVSVDKIWRLKISNIEFLSIKLSLK